MKKILFSTLSALLFLSAFLAGSAFPAGAKDTKVMEVKSMVGIPKAYTGTANPVRGLGGGALPWVIGSAQAELKSNGKLELKVRGLVLDPNDPDVIARGIGGTNPVASFKAIVSCQSTDAAGNANIVNVATNPFPATATGNSKIEARLDLPQPCIGPIIFVTTPTDAWLAATGF